MTRSPITFWVLNCVEGFVHLLDPPQQSQISQWGGKELLAALQEQIEKLNRKLFDIHIDINQEDEEDLVAKRKTLEDSIAEHRAHEKKSLGNYSI